MQGPYDNNFIKAAEEAINFEFRYLGLILLAAGVLLGVCALLYNAKRADKKFEKTGRNVCFFISNRKHLKKLCIR